MHRTVRGRSVRRSTSARARQAVAAVAVAAVCLPSVAAAPGGAVVPTTPPASVRAGDGISLETIFKIPQWAGMVVDKGYQYITQYLYCRKQDLSVLYPGEAYLKALGKCVGEDPGVKEFRNLNGILQSELSQSSDLIERIERTIRRHDQQYYEDRLDPILNSGERGALHIDSLVKCLDAMTTGATCVTYGRGGRAQPGANPTVATIEQIARNIATEQYRGSPEFSNEVGGSYADVLEKFVGQDKSAAASVLGLAYDGIRDAHMKAWGGRKKDGVAGVVTPDFAGRVNDRSTALVSLFARYFEVQRMGLELREFGFEVKGSRRPMKNSQRLDQIGKRLQDLARKGADRVPSLDEAFVRFSLIDPKTREPIFAAGVRDSYAVAVDGADAKTVQVVRHVGEVATVADMSSLPWATGRSRVTIQEITQRVDQVIDYDRAHKKNPNMFPNRLWARANVRFDPDIKVRHVQAALTDWLFGKVTELRADPINGWVITNNQQEGSCAVQIDVHRARQGYPSNPSDLGGGGNADDRFVRENKKWVPSRADWSTWVTNAEPLWSIHGVRGANKVGIKFGRGALVRCDKEVPSGPRDARNALAGHRLEQLSQHQLGGVPWLMTSASGQALR